MSRNYSHPNRIASMPRGEKHWKYDPNPSILTMHKRIHRKYGKASTHNCVDCGSQAKDWSLKAGREYSDNIEDYDARCRRCHVLHDDKSNDRSEKISQGLKLAYKEGRR